VLITNGWDVAPLVRCYAEARSAVRERARRAGLVGPTMFELWAHMGLVGVQALGREYAACAAGSGRLKNPAVPAAISIAMAHDLRRALALGVAPDPVWAGLLDAGDMALPRVSLWSFAGEVVARGTGPWGRFVEHSSAFGEAHARRGAARSLARLELDAFARGALVDDLLAVGSILVAVQRRSLLIHFGRASGRDLDDLGPYFERAFARLLGANLSGALCDAGLVAQGAELAARW
jgi:hypothetical protein